VRLESPGEYRVLLPLLNPGLAPDLVDLAGRLASGRPGKVIILGIVEVPSEAPLSEGLGLARAYRIMLDNVAESIRGRTEVETMVRVHREAWCSIVETAVEEQCDLLLLPWKGFSSTPDRIYGATIDEILKNPPCDTVVAKGSISGGCRRLLLPVRGGSHAELALRVASALAASEDGSITILHDRAGERQGEWDLVYESFQRQIAGHPLVSRVVTTNVGVLPSILQEAPKHDLVILGAAADLMAGPSPLGPVGESVSSKVEKPVLVVKTKQWAGGTLAASQEESRQRASFLERVDRWFAENTFHLREFTDLEHLLELKERGSHYVSLAVPVRGKAKSVSGFVRRLKEDYQERVPLVDEVVLVASDADVAEGVPAALGVPVLLPQKLLPEYGHYPGLGEEVWKVLAALRGDLVVWLDTENRRGTDPSHVVALLGPLLREPGIAFVKGFFTPPSFESGWAKTEDPLSDLLVRPLLNLLVPELSGLVDPLCGQWSGRRAVLEAVPFLTGDGYDLALLIELHACYGVGAIAQVDMGEDARPPRAYRQGIEMAANSLLQVCVRRLEDRLHLRLMEDCHRSAKVVRRLETGYRLEVAELKECERPPLLEVPSYAERRRPAALDRGAR